jgi:hypothetical protein
MVPRAILARTSCYMGTQFHEIATRDIDIGTRAIGIDTNVHDRVSLTWVPMSML